MVEGKWVAVIALATAIGGSYLTAMRAGTKMCANPTAFNTQMTTFAAKCPAPDTLGMMQYFLL